MKRIRALCILSIGILAACTAKTDAEMQPFVPDDPDFVLKHVDRRTKTEETELTALKTAHQNAPRDPEIAAKLARFFIEEGRVTGDPQYLNNARRTLEPWWEDSDAPASIFVLRATLKQNAHAFDDALLDLDRALTLSPTDAQAWMTRAVILMVQGRLDDAQKSCAPLARLSSNLIAEVCRAEVDGRYGKGREALERITRALQNTGNVSVSENVYAQTAQAELAMRIGEDVVAENAFRNALTLAPDDTYLMGAYSDFLIAKQRETEVLKLLEQAEETDALLLRRAIAEKKVDPKQATNTSTLLDERFASARARKDTTHRREEARFMLEVHENAKEALSLARANFELQREPEDVRLLLKAALAAEQFEAAVPAVSFVLKTQLEDKEIQTLVEEIQKATNS